MSFYSDLIVRATGCSRSEVDEVEDIMRNVIFHSTLDWQTHDELIEGARKAHTVLLVLRAQSKKEKMNLPSWMQS